DARTRTPSATPRRARADREAPQRRSSPPRGHRRGSRTVNAVARFRALHESGCFVLPNPWDRGSAVMLPRLVFQALASTSAGFAFSLGLPDGAAAVPMERLLTHLEELVGVTPLPVNADFQNGYGDEPSDVAANVSSCVATGVAGLSIEDATGVADAPLYDETLAVERI